MTGMAMLRLLRPFRSMPDTGDKVHQQAAKFRQGIAQFNARHFFDAHETWEEIWLQAAEPDKTFFQGIIQIAAAFHHYTRGNVRGACSLLTAGLRRLAAFSAVHPGIAYGIALDPLRAAAQHWVAALGEGRDLGVAQLPKIHDAKPEQVPASE